MFNFNLKWVLQVLISASMVSANSYALAGQYDNQVLDEVSAKEFIMILDQPVPKLFKRTQLPNSLNHLCTVHNGQASSVAIASKLRVVGGSGAVSTLQAAPVTNNTVNTTASTTAQNSATAQANNNKPNTSTSINNRTNSGEVLNTQNAGNQSSLANNSTYVPSLPTPRAQVASTNATTNANHNSTIATNNIGSNSANTTTSTSRANNQATSVQTSQNTQARPTVVSNSNQNKPNSDVPYVGNAIATVNLAVNFGNDSDKLSIKDKTLLKELAQALNSTELRLAEFAIVGHTNSTGPYLRNLELSCARAIAVRNHLIDLGVKATRLTPYGYGPDKPLANMNSQEVSNRRVEISRAK